MPHSSTQALSDQLQVLFDAGTCAGLTDGELIDRFRTSRDEGGDRAFEALVTRHGPMVIGVCRNILDDPTDAHDAFQATFLVLARRAGSIRQRDSVGSWLYGVAVRVAARSRVASIRRRIRDRRTLAAAGTVAMPATEARSTSSIDRDEGAALVHQELDRLPEKYRAPIVLCYLEGLTHDEAAARLSWPVGTVRSRLSRARDRLRSRLTRRGVTAPASLGPLSAWLLGDPSASSATATATLPVQLSTSLARSATRFAIGQLATTDSVSAVALRLAQGVLTTMMFKKLTIAGCAVLSLGLAGLGGGVFLVRASRAQEARDLPALPAATSGQAAKPAAPPAPLDPSLPADPLQLGLNRIVAAIPDDLDPLLRELLEASRLRADAQRAYYQEGRITIDRFLDALARLERVQLLAARTDAERMAIRQHHLNLLAEVEKRENVELQAGRATVADVSESRQRHLEAIYELKIIEKEAAEKSAIQRRLSELERKVEQILGSKPKDLPRIP
jgi:RNA polymerase sigma factor (sigma-70 family)